jgi:hypothetical protein
MNLTRHAPSQRPASIARLSTLLALALLIATIPHTSLTPAAGASDGIIVPGFTQLSIGPGDDHSSEEIHLPFAISFFGTTYRSLYINNNGNVTFDAPLSAYTPFSLLSTSHPMIAPFFGDVDTRGVEAERAINSDFARYGVGTFEGRRAFGVTWGGVGVGYYDSRVDKLNKFQMLIVERPDEGPGDFDIVFNYDQIQWETGEASGGQDGLGGASARAGFTNGSDTSFEMPGSAVNGAFLDGTPTGLRHNSNVNVAGRYVFPVRNGLSAVYTSTGFLVNGTPLPLCPCNDADPDFMCRTERLGFDIGFNGCSDFGTSRLNLSASWSGSAQSAFELSGRSGWRDLLTLTTGSYAGPARVRYTFRFEGTLEGEGLDSSEGAVELGQTVNGVATDASAGQYVNADGIRYSDLNGTSAVDFLTVSQDSPVEFNPDFNGHFHAQTHVDQQVEIRLRTLRAGAAGSVNADFGHTVRLLSVTVVDPSGNPIPNLTLTSVSGTQYPLDPANAAPPADTTPPVVACPAPLVLEAGADCLAFMPDITGQAVASDNVTPASGLSLTQSVAPGASLPPGNTPVTVNATDAAGNQASCTTNVTVRAAAAPDITSASASPNVLWPPNHKMVDVAVSVSTAEACGGPATCRITGVSSNEPVEGAGGGSLAPDWEVVGQLLLKLRAERAGSGGGRVYTVTVTCLDAAGNSSTKDVLVTVPHDRGDGR